jgi:hypothetical protein
MLKHFKNQERQLSVSLFLFTVIAPIYSCNEWNCVTYAFWYHSHFEKDIFINHCDYLASGLSPACSTLKEHDGSETGSVSTIKWNGRRNTCWLNLLKGTHLITAPLFSNYWAVGNSHMVVLPQAAGLTPVPRSLAECGKQPSGAPLDSISSLRQHGRLQLTSGDSCRKLYQSHSSNHSKRLYSQSLNSKHSVCSADSSAIVFSVLNSRTITVGEVFAPSIPPPTGQLTFQNLSNTESDWHESSYWKEKNEFLGQWFLSTWGK